MARAAQLSVKPLHKYAPCPVYTTPFLSRFELTPPSDSIYNLGRQCVRCHSILLDFFLITDRATMRAPYLLDHRCLEALLSGGVRASAYVVLLVLLTVTLWLPTASADAGESGTANADEAERVENSKIILGQDGAAQGGVGVCSVNNHNYCITPEADFREWRRLVQWTASSRFHSRTGAICLNLVSRQGEEMPSITGILSPSYKRGGVSSQYRKDDVSPESQSPAGPGVPRVIAGLIRSLFGDID